MAVRSKINKKKVEPLRKKCDKCNENVILSKYYKSNNPKHRDGLMNYCKDCLKPDNPHDLTEVRRLLFGLDRPFINEVWIKSVEEVKRRKFKDGLLGCYLKNLQMKNSKYEYATWSDTEEVEVSAVENEQEHTSCKTVEYQDDQDSDPDSTSNTYSNRNKEDVLRMLGYDPFKYEDQSDKERLYASLVDFLDDSTMEDGFKLKGVISIVKTFNQIDKIDDTIAMLSKDYKNNIGLIKSLSDTKEKQHKTALAIAKDNGISVNHNNNKSKGAGTLSGIIKQLQEKGIEAAEVNLYDIETCEGMKQVADISNRSIFEQLVLNENDYTEMIKEQREMIQVLTEKSERLEEENRMLRKKVRFLESSLSEQG